MTMTLTVNLSDTDEILRAIATLSGAYQREIVNHAAREILSVARETLEETGTLTSDKLDEIADYACDAGNNELIYTWRSRCFLMGSNNHDAHRDDMGEPPETAEFAATCALRADVCEHPDYKAAEALITD